MEKKQYPKLLAELVLRNETQGDLAKLLGVTETTLSFKLNGKSDFTIREVEQICEHFDKDYYSLFK